MKQRLAVGLFLAWIAPAAAVAGPPPPSCLPGCPGLLSNQISFNLGNPNGYEIVATLDGCGFCVTLAPGVFRLVGSMHVDFGAHYTAAGCAAADGLVTFPIGAPTVFTQATPPPGVKYVPADPGLPFPRAGGPALRTQCVDPTNLDYAIPHFALIGSSGATTPGAVFPQAVLTLPTNVRGLGDTGTRTRTNVLPSFSFREDLSFAFSVTKAPGSPFRFWPDGLPFRLGPAAVTYKHDRVDLGFVSPGPPPYEPLPPAATGLTGDPNLIAVDCPGCTATEVYNGGYLESTAWTPSAAFFDASGLDVDLALTGAMSSVTYEPVFPRGVRITLDGPATVEVRDGAISGGSFDDGQVQVEYGDGSDLACGNTYTLALSLSASAPPELGPGGALMAGVPDLTPAPLPWTYNEVSDLGCGTLRVPAVNNDRGPAGTVDAPQVDWLASAVTPVAGRGLYAGVNYNRNRICESAGLPTGSFCADAADCGPGDSCVVDRFSPLCPAWSGLLNPTWRSTIEDEDTFHLIGPDDGPQKEMAFFLRASGVTGVFDDGSSPTSIGSPPVSFDVDFDRFGLAFRDSHSGDGLDTLLRGALSLPWPSDTTIPFDNLSICSCGRLASARVPEALPSRTLGYWDQEFRPSSLDFLADRDGDGCDDEDCLNGAGYDCGDGASSSCKVCIGAVTPVQHFSPDPSSRFGLLPDGQPDPDGIRPISDPGLEFDAYLGEAWDYQVTSFLLSDWDGSPVGYGYRDAVGEIKLPLFGLTPAGIKVQRDSGSGLHEVDLHAPGDPSTSYVTAGRKLAADTIDATFKLDYFTPSATEVADGDDGVGRGRFLGFSTGAAGLDDKIDLGALPVGAALTIPGPDAILGDVGPQGAMRLWGNVSDTSTDLLQEILPANRLSAGARDAYDRALDALGNPVGDAIPDPQDLVEDLFDTGAIDEFVGALHPDVTSLYQVGAVSPETVANRVAGYLGIPLDPVSLDAEMIDLAQIEADIGSISAAGETFFDFTRSQLGVERYVREIGDAGEQAIMSLGRRIVPGSIGLPGKLDVGLPPGIPGLQWEFDYDILPFRFISLTGSLDLTQAGLSGLGFEEANATLTFFGDGDWYFTASASMIFNGTGVDGDVLLGNTKDLTPLRRIDPEVADFLGEIPRFDGAFLRCGLRVPIVNFGCVLRISGGVRVGGWYLHEADSFGGSLDGFVTGRGACLVSVKGSVRLIGGQIGELFKLEGIHWVAGGIGWDCDEDGWDSPRDVLRDGGCLACVADVSCEYTDPPGEMSCRRPDFTCR